MLRENVLHHTPVDIREPIIAPIVAEREPLVIEPEQMQQRRVQIVHVDFILHRAVAKFIRRPVFDAGLHAAAREPDAKSAGL